MPTISPKTRRAYDLALARFIRWCRERGAEEDVVSPEALAEYLTDRLKECSPSTVRVDAAGIAHHFKAQGLPDPRSEPEVAEVLEFVRMGLYGYEKRRADKRRRQRLVRLEGAQGKDRYRMLVSELPLARGPFKGAWLAGQRARAEGRAVEDNDYDLGRFAPRGGSWSRTFALYWIAGWFGVVGPNGGAQLD